MIRFLWRTKLKLNLIPLYWMILSIPCFLFLIFSIDNFIVLSLSVLSFVAVANFYRGLAEDLFEEDLK